MEAEQVERWLRWIVVGIAIVAATYLGDWAVLRVRVSHGTAYRTLQVNQFLATPLKGEKEEYDMMDSTEVVCSRSLFPQQGHSPCWWLVRHTAQWR